MPVSDDQLNEKQTEVEEAREKLVKLRAERVARERAATNQVTVNQLDAELEKIKREIAFEEQAQQAATSLPGAASSSLEAARAAMNGPKKPAAHAASGESKE